MQLNRLYNVKLHVFRSSGERTYNSDNENIHRSKFAWYAERSSLTDINPKSYHLRISEDGSFSNESCWNLVCSLLTTRKTYFLKKKYLGNRPSKKSHFIRVWTSNLHFYGYFKNGKMNFFQNSSLGRTPSALLVRLKKILHNRLKNWIISNKHKYAELFPHLWFFFGPANNKWFHPNLNV